MNARFTIPALLLVVTLAFSCGLLGGAVIPQGPSLPVFITGDQNGEVNSCGCPREDIGGVTRKAAFVDTLRDSGWEFLLVDAGDLTPLDGNEGQNGYKIETLARAMATMKYDAIALGDHDLEHGPAFTARLVEWLGQPVLATNYTLPAEIPSVAERTITVRGKTIGLLAFLDPGLAATRAPWVKARSWESAKGRVKALAAQTDLVIALAHAPDTSAVARLASLYPQIDLVIGAHEGRTAADIFRRNGSYVVGSSGRGRYLTRVEIDFDEAGKVKDMASAFLPVVETWGRRAKVDTLLAAYYRDVRKLLNSDAYLAELQENLKEPPVAYVGSEACASCHQAEFTQWRGTHHARAKQSLVEKEKDHDSACQVCHTVGYGYRTGFASPILTPNRWEVGCESCHGGGAEHVTAPEKPYGDLIEDVCLTCHDSENSPDFDYATYLPRVTHGPAKPK